MPTEKGKYYGFDSFRLEVAERRLLQEGVPLALAPKVFDTLVALVESGGRLIEKEDLMEAVWADTFVEEANLTVNISTLRKILGENPSGQSYIETVPRRGYRFTSRVTEVGENENLAEETPAESAMEDGLSAPYIPKANFFSQNRLVVFGICAIAVVTLTIFLWRQFQIVPAVAETKINSIAILPFTSLNPKDEDKLFGLGMTDALITRLSNVRSIIVRPTNAVLRYSDTAQEPRTIGREMNVDAVLLGQVQRSGEQARITIQFVRTSDGTPLWAETFDDQAGNIFAMQDSISAKMADALTLNLTREERQSLTKRYTENVEAYELYLKGRYYWFKWTPEDWLKARDYFQQAIDKDPNYALAYAGLADSYGVFGFTSPPKEVGPRSMELGLKALSLDPNLPDGYLSIGPTQFFYEWNWPAAERSYKRAFELNPNNPLAHDLYSIYLSSQGRSDESLAESKRARDLDPLSSYLNWGYGESFYYARRYEQAAEQLDRTLALEPNFFQARFTLARVREMQGNRDEAVAEYLKAIRLSGENAQNEADLREAYARFGWTAFWQKRLEQLRELAKREYVSSYRFVEAGLRIGDTGITLTALEKAYEERSPEMVYLNVEPLFDPLRGDARFQELIKRMRFASPA